MSPRRPVARAGARHSSLKLKLLAPVAAAYTAPARCNGIANKTTSSMAPGACAIARLPLATLNGASAWPTLAIGTAKATSISPNSRAILNKWMQVWSLLSIVSGGLLGRYQYDLANHRSIETLAGLQFNDCCIQLRLVYRDGVIYEPTATLSDSVTNPERDRSIYFQIEFKGLAGVGRALENVLEESIFGYRAP